MHFSPKEVSTFLRLYPFPTHKVKHTSSQQIPNRKIKTQFLFLLNTFTDDSNQDVQEVIWTDGPSSEFKNKYTIEILRRLTEKYNKPFTWKFFATSHGKGTVDGVRGNCKSIVWQKTFSKGEDCIIVQNADEFPNVVSRFVSSTKVAYIDQSTIDAKINYEMPLKHTVRVPSISKAHMIHCTTHSAKLWRNCAYKLEQPESLFT